MKYLLSIITLVFILGCSKQFCQDARQSIKVGTDALDIRWKCQIKGCLYGVAAGTVDHTLCINNQEPKERIAASLVCSAAVNALSAITSAGVAVKCRCDFYSVNSDLSKPAYLCSILSLFP